MNVTSRVPDLTDVIDATIDESDLVVLADEDDGDANFTPVPHGLILRTSTGPVLVMGDDGRWHRHSTVRS
jgi:hypothetical protein